MREGEGKDSEGEQKICATISILLQEMLLALAVQVIGVMLYGYCLGAIASILANNNGPRVNFLEKMEVTLYPTHSL